jgi:hypothetical protein
MVDKETILTNLFNKYIKETIDSLDAKNNKETSLLELLTSNMRSIESNY